MNYSEIKKQKEQTPEFNTFYEKLKNIVSSIYKNVLS